MTDGIQITYDSTLIRRRALGYNCNRCRLLSTMCHKLFTYVLQSTQPHIEDDSLIFMGELTPLKIYVPFFWMTGYEPDRL
jgi:hypothetical protein